MNGYRKKKGIEKPTGWMESHKVSMRIKQCETEKKSENRQKQSRYECDASTGTKMKGKKINNRFYDSYWRFLK